MNLATSSRHVVRFFFGCRSDINRHTHTHTHTEEHGSVFDSLSLTPGYVYIVQYITCTLYTILYTILYSMQYAILL